MTTAIFIEDAVFPQLFTSAIEAYEVKHKATHRSRAKDKIDTFSFLWGHIIPESGLGKATDSFTYHDYGNGRHSRIQARTKYKDAI